MRVGVIYGGRSGEHEVSLASAESVMKALREGGHEVVPLLVPKTGPFPFAPADIAAHCDAVFPIIHGTTGEDGCLQGLLELADVPYAGSGVLGSAMNMDKVTQKLLFAAAGFPLTPWLHFSADQWGSGVERARLTADIESQLGFPCFVKPASLGSSVGVSKVHRRDELAAAVEAALAYDQLCVVEQGVAEAREIESAVLAPAEAGAAARVSQLGEIFPSNEFYDYAAKYVDGKSRTVVPADLPHHAAENIRTLAARAFAALRCDGYARIDFLVRGSDGHVFLNEINTLPGFTSISMFPQMWAASGLAYPALLTEILRLAVERHRRAAAVQRDFGAELARLQAGKPAA